MTQNAISKAKNILVLPGGGATGIISARILQSLEERAGLPTHQLFDEIWASSVGSMLTAYLTVPSEANGIPLSAEAVVHLFRKKFAHPWAAWWSALTVCKQIGRDVKMKDTAVPVKVLCAKVSHPRVWQGLYSGRLRTESIGFGSQTHGQTLLAEVVRASVAVYPFLQPQKLRDESIDQEFYAIDAGCGVCSQPTLDPVPYFLGQLLSEQDGEGRVRIHFLSNGWARADFPGLQRNGSYQRLTLVKNIELLNFDVNLEHMLSRLGTGARSRQICANWVGSGFASISALEQKGFESSELDNSKFLDQVVTDLLRG